MPDSTAILGIDVVWEEGLVAPLNAACTTVFLEDHLTRVHDDLQIMLKLQDKIENKRVSIWDTKGLLTCFDTLDMIYAGSPNPPHFTARVLSRCLTTALYSME